MDNRHIRRINDNLLELIDVTSRLDEIIYELRELNVLNEYMVRHLNKYHERRRKLREFYSMLMGRGPNAFDFFLLVLRKTENFRAEVLLSPMINPLQGELVSLPIDELDIGAGDNESTDIVVERHPNGVFMDTDETGEHPVKAYRMRSRPRGHALIINILKTEGKEDRVGSDVDYLKLQNLFKQLGFEVFAHENLTQQEMKAQIMQHSVEPKLKNLDCLVVFIMCHGRQNDPHERSSVDLIASDGEIVDTNWITAQFQSHTSPFVTARRKPKLFFFQACRSARDDATPSLNIRYVKDIETDSELMSPKNGNGEEQHHRGYEDTVLGFSTIPGFVSMRDRKTGSWFVDAFCEVIAKNAYKYDLDTMWTMIDDKIREKRGPQGYQTLELVKRSFGKLYFNPHLYEQTKGSDERRSSSNS